VSRLKLPGIGSHHSARPQTDEWLTPPHLLATLGVFDLDPCAPPPAERPWPTARQHFSLIDDGLAQPWSDRVWLNPPYSEVELWMDRLAQHGDGIALVFARCETAWWFRSVWPCADAILFLAGRVTFYRGDGTASKAGHNSGGPSVLIAYGAHNVEALRASGLAGALVERAEMTGRAR
jgi:hypothetical protein